MEHGLVELVGDLLLGLFDWLFPKSPFLRALAWVGVITTVLVLAWLLWQ